MIPIPGLIGPLATSGEFLSIASGLSWAVSLILFRISGRKVPPVGLNIFKNFIGLLLIIPTMLILGQSFNAGVAPKVVATFILSGVLGIAVADTFVLASLNRLGAGLFAIVDCFYSPCIIILSVIFLGERMTPLRIVGAALVVSAVLTVSTSKTEQGGPKSRKDLIAGTFLCLLSIIFMAMGIIMVKPYLPLVSASWSTMVRLAGGFTALLLFLPFYKGRAAALKPLFKPANWTSMVPGAFFGTYLSLIFWMGGMKYTSASVAAVLNQLNVIFAVLLAAMFLKERMDKWKILAAVLAFVGALLTTAGM